MCRNGVAQRVSVKLLLYEHITGGCPDIALPPSLLREGRAMVEAVAADLARIAGVNITLLCDHRLKLNAPGCQLAKVDSAASALEMFDRLAAIADLTLVIAPEADGVLLQRCRRVARCGGRLIGPAAALVELCSDKQLTAEHLAAAGVQIPRGVAIQTGQELPVDFSYPAVIKPRDGCGSQGVKLIASAAEAAAFGVAPWPARLEQFCPGVAVSVAVLCGPRELRALTPCAQRLTSDGQFQYLGGALPLRPELAGRAVELALRAVRSLPEPRGYVGVDLVLGEGVAEAGLQHKGDSPIFVAQKLGQSPTSQSPGDFVIEINPRIITSYVGLRAACRGNLAEAMLRIAAGEPTELSFRDEPLQFDADGTVYHFQEKP